MTISTTSSKLWHLKPDTWPDLASSFGPVNLDSVIWTRLIRHVYMILFIWTHIGHIYLDQSCWSQLFGPIYLDYSVWIILFGLVFLNPSILTRLIGPVYFDPFILICQFAPVYLDPSSWTRLFGPVYLDPSILDPLIWTRLIGPVYLDPSIWTCLILWKLSGVESITLIQTPFFIWPTSTWLGGDSGACLHAQPVHPPSSVSTIWKPSDQHPCSQDCMLPPHLLVALHQGGQIQLSLPGVRTYIFLCPHWPL